jgi:hypothetical protein
VILSEAFVTPRAFDSAAAAAAMQPIVAKVYRFWNILHLPPGFTLFVTNIW